MNPIGRARLLSHGGSHGGRKPPGRQGRQDSERDTAEQNGHVEVDDESQAETGDLDRGLYHRGGHRVDLSPRLIPSLGVPGVLAVHTFWSARQGGGLPKFCVRRRLLTPMPPGPPPRIARGRAIRRVQGGGSVNQRPALDDLGLHAEGLGVSAASNDSHAPVLCVTPHALDLHAEDLRVTADDLDGHAQVMRRNRAGPRASRPGPVRDSACPRRSRRGPAHDRRGPRRSRPGPPS